MLNFSCLIFHTHFHAQNPGAVRIVALYAETHPDKANDPMCRTPSDDTSGDHCSRHTIRAARVRSVSHRTEESIHRHTEIVSPSLDFIKTKKTESPTKRMPL